jgi:hypothetical protein
MLPAAAARWRGRRRPAADIAAKEQRSLRLSVVEEMAGPPVTYAGLADRIREVVRGD